MKNLTEKNFFHYAVSNLKSHYVSENEFKLLLKHIVYIKRLLKKFRVDRKDLNFNLLLNHFIILYNEFHAIAMTHILFYQLGNSYYSELKAILLILEKIDNSEVLFIEDVTIEMNQIIANSELTNLYKKQLSPKNEFIKSN